VGAGGTEVKVWACAFGALTARTAETTAMTKIAAARRRGRAVVDIAGSRTVGRARRRSALDRDARTGAGWTYRVPGRRAG
jgi:hypothetical protein